MPALRVSQQLMAEALREFGPGLRQVGLFSQPAQQSRAGRQHRIPYVEVIAADVEKQSAAVRYKDGKEYTLSCDAEAAARRKGSSSP